MRSSGVGRRRIGRYVLRLVVVTVVALGSGAGAAAASPAAMPTAGFTDVPCGTLGTVWIAGHGSGLGFGEDGSVWRRQEGQMRGLEAGYDCHGTAVVRIR